MDRWTRIELLVEQRARSFDYLKQVHQGDAHWLSAVTLGPQDAALSRSVESLQVLRWFYLGVSLGPLLQLPSGPPFVRARSSRRPPKPCEFTEGGDGGAQKPYPELVLSSAQS